MTGAHRTGSNRPAYFDEYRAAFGEGDLDRAARVRRKVDRLPPSRVMLDSVDLASFGPEVVDCPRCGGDHWLDIGDCVCRHVRVRETSFAGRYTDRVCLVCSAALPDRSWDS